MNPPISDGKSFSEEARMALPVPEAGGGLLLALSFLGTASFLGGMGLVLALYLWTVNRSAQLKELSPTATAAKRGPTIIAWSHRSGDQNCILKSRWSVSGIRQIH